MGRSVLHWVCVFALGVTQLVGCQDVVESTTYPMQVTESRPDLTAVPSVGVRICEADTENCVMTNQLGRADLRVPSDREVMFTIEKEGYGRILVADVSDDTFGAGGRGDGVVTDWRLYPPEQLAAIAEQLGTRYPWVDGIVGLRATGSAASTGATFTPVSSTIDMVGERFYYDADSEPKQYSLDLEATTATLNTKRLPLFEGGFTEVSPGEQQFEFGGTAADCSLLEYGWPVEGAPNTIRVPVRDGYTTLGSMACD